MRYWFLSPKGHSLHHISFIGVGMCNQRLRDDRPADGPGDPRSAGAHGQPFEPG